MADSLLTRVSVQASYSSISGDRSQTSESLTTTMACLKLRAALSSQSSVHSHQWDGRTAVLPSPTDSECSTLLEFAIEPSVTAGTPDGRLDADNCAWRRDADNRRFSVPAPWSLRRPASAHRASASSAGSFPAPAPVPSSCEAQLLDAEDRAWDYPAGKPRSASGRQRRAWGRRLFSGVRREKGVDSNQEALRTARAPPPPPTTQPNFSFAICANISIVALSFSRITAARSCSTAVRSSRGPDRFSSKRFRAASLRAILS
ncbi:hypothetical protein EVG20_g5092, partial [Dentipellis fragilis]